MFRKNRTLESHASESSVTLTSLNVSVNDQGFANGRMELRGFFYMQNPKAIDRHMKIANSSTKRMSKKQDALLNKAMGSNAASQGDHDALYVASGQSHVLFIDSGEGSVHVLGPNDRSKLNKTVWGEPIAALKSAQGVAAGLFHSIAWSHKEVYSWGYNVNASVLANARPGSRPCGQLGRSGQALMPGRVPALSGVVHGAACGNSHTLVLTSDGMFAFGLNEEGQLARDPLSLPVADVPFLVTPFASTSVRVAKVACGGHHSLAITEMRQLYTWGWNESGQLGHSAKSKYCSTPIRVFALESVADADGGNFHTVACTTKGRVFSWGGGHGGVLGRKGQTGAVCLPVALPPGVRGVSVNCFGNRSAICTISGHVYAWGALLGPNHGNSAKPLEIASSEFVYQVSLGTSHMAMLIASEAEMARSVLFECMRAGEIPDKYRELLSCIPEPYWTAFQRDQVSTTFPKHSRFSAASASFVLTTDADQQCDVRFKGTKAGPDVVSLAFTVDPFLPSTVRVRHQETIKVGKERILFPITVTQQKHRIDSRGPAFYVAVKAQGQSCALFLRFMFTSIKGTSLEATRRPHSNMHHDEPAQQVNPLMALVHAGKKLKRICELDSNLTRKELLLALVRYPDRKEDVTAYLTTLVMWTDVRWVLEQLLQKPYENRPKEVSAFLQSLLRYNSVEAQSASLLKRFHMEELEQQHADSKGDDALLGLRSSQGATTERGIRAKWFGKAPRVDPEYLYVAKMLFEGFSTQRETLQGIEVAKEQDCRQYWSQEVLQSLVDEGYLERRQSSGGVNFYSQSQFTTEMLRRRTPCPAVQQVEPLEPFQQLEWTHECERLEGKASGGVASQITCVMAALYAQIRPLHFMKRSWEDSSGCSPLGSLMHLVMRLSSWTATQVLLADNQELRTRRFENAVAIAEALVGMCNFCGVFAVILGITQHSVSRLQLEDHCSNQTRSSLKALVQLISPEHNHDEYRGRLASVKARPVIPHVGLACSAVTFALDGNETFFDGQKVNREKVYLVSDVINNFLEFQHRVPYKLRVSPKAAEFFTTKIKGEPEDELYVLSYKHKAIKIL